MKFLILTTLGALILLPNYAEAHSSCDSLSRFEVSHILRYTPNSVYSNGKSLRIEKIDPQLSACTLSTCLVEEITLESLLSSQGDKCAVEVSIPNLNLKGKIIYTSDKLQESQRLLY